jgi:sugar/nucleoside kinase (ribokinase family)
MLRPTRLVVVGTVLVDILLYLDRLPEPGGVAMASRSLVTPGAGYNLLAAAARLGLPAGCAGLVGTGSWGDMIAAALKRFGVPLLLPRLADRDSGFDVGLVETGTGRQPTFFGAPGAESKLTLGDLEAVPLAPGDAVYVSGYDLWYPEQGAALARWAAGIGQEYLVVFDPGPLAGEIEPARLDAVTASASILSLNTAEAARLAGEGPPQRLAAALTGKVAREGWVVLRAGAAGCWIASRTTPAWHIPARPATPVDPTGAGDAHLATLIARLAAGDDMATAARWANAAASLTIERVGPSTSPAQDELAEAMAAWDG